MVLTTKSPWDLKEAANKYKANAHFVYSEANTFPVLTLLSPRPGETILDLGCGSGELTYGPLSAVGPTGRVVGIDASNVMIQKAAATAPEDIKAEVTFHVVDGHEVLDGLRKENLPAEGGYDAVFSNAALHWMKRDPDVVVKGVKRCLKPGGRFVGEMGGFLNMMGVRAAIHNALRRRGGDPNVADPWFFPSPKQYSAILESQGFKVDFIELIPRPTPLPTGLLGWLRTFASSFPASALPSSASADELKAETDRMWSEVEDECRADMYREGEGWTVMYVRLRFRAILPVK